MSETEIRPALRPEQWAGSPRVVFKESKVKYRDPHGVDLEPNGTLTVFDDSWAVSVLPEDRHALAAVSLYGQPFGFTHEDVEWMRGLVRSAAGALRVSGGYWPECDAEQAASLIARIAALLPPEQP